jgi:hypothetical protein
VINLTFIPLPRDGHAIWADVLWGPQRHFFNHHDQGKQSKYAVVAVVIVHLKGRVEEIIQALKKDMF